MLPHLRRFAFLGSVVLGAALLLLAGCSSAPTTANERADLQDDVAVTHARLLREDPTLGEFLGNCYGYVLFPSVAKGGIGIGGAEGWGIVYEQGRPIGYARLSQATVGAILGGQTFAELIAFQNAEALQFFKTGKLAFAANASAVAMKSGAAASANYTNGVAVFTMPKGGLMFEAAIGGQQFYYQPEQPPAAGAGS